MPDLAVIGITDVIAAALLVLGREEYRNEVPFSRQYLRPDRRDLIAVHGRLVVRWPPPLRNQLQRAGVEDFGQSLFRGDQILELRLGVAEPDLACWGVNVVQWNKPCQPLPALRLDHEMSYRQGAALNDYGLHIAGDPTIGGASFAPDHEHYLCHSQLPRSRHGFREPCAGVPDANHCARRIASR